MPSIPNWLSQRALQKKNHPALLFERNTWTFADLDAISQHMAIKLAVMGIVDGSCVAVTIANHPGYVLLLHALSKLGAIAVPINIRLSAQEVEWQMQDCQAQWLVYDRTTAVIAAEIQNRRSIELFNIADLEVEPLESYSYPLSGDAPSYTPSHLKSHLKSDIDLDAVQSIIYTSGTTGFPKGVQLTYGNHWYSAIGSGFNLGVGNSDRWLLCLPLYHVGGLAIIWRSLIYGTTVILHQRFDQEAVIQAIATQQVTTISLVPTMLSRLLESEKFPASLTHWQNLRGILLGGAAPGRELWQRCLALKLPIVPTYGLTEAASQVTALLPQDLERKPGSSGQPLLCDRLRIVALEDNDTEVAVGEVGQILVQGANVMKGYINRAQVDAIQSGWLHTGDLGYVDREGFLYVVSRRSDLIISGGENIYPAEVEAILQQHPAIIEVCIVGTEDPEWGEVVTAVAIAKQPITLDRVQEFCASRHLARYKLPRILHLVESLPKTSNGKLSRQQVREFVSQFQ